MYDENSQKAVSDVYNEREMINLAKDRLKNEMEFEKRLKSWNEKVPIYFVSIPSLTYSQCNNIFLSKGKKEVKWTNLYWEYRKELFKQLKENNLIKIPDQIKFLRIDLEIFISYSQRDADNIEKPFIDRLFEYIGRDDNCIKCITKTNAIKVDEKKEEGVYFKITGMNERDFTNSRLSVQYENQFKEEQHQNRKRQLCKVK
jgi:hypothetical protein